MPLVSIVSVVTTEVLGGKYPVLRYPALLHDLVSISKKDFESVKFLFLVAIVTLQVL